jgi:hypothetical protein
MNYTEAIERALPGFRRASEENPDKLVVLASARHNPMEMDGPGWLYLLVHAKLEEIAKLMKITEVIYFHWQGTVYNVQDDRIIVLVQADEVQS